MSGNVNIFDGKKIYPNPPIVYKIIEKRNINYCHRRRRPNQYVRFEKRKNDTLQCIIYAGILKSDIRKLHLCSRPTSVCRGEKVAVSRYFTTYRNRVRSERSEKAIAYAIIIRTA